MNTNPRNSAKQPRVFLAGLLLLTSQQVFSLDAGVTDCDTLAANPYDTNKLSVGVKNNQIDTTLAVPACQTAVSNNPSSARLQYQYGRALDAKGDFVLAFTWYSKAAEQNYAPAQDGLGILYYYGDGTEKKLG